MNWRDRILDLIDEHEKTRRNALNLIASENILSETALKALSSDLNGRYAADLYGGTQFVREIVRLTEDLIKKLFKANYVSVKPVSGTIAVLSALHAFSKPGEPVAILNFSDGGFPLNLSGYLRKPIYLPYDEEILNINTEKAVEILSKTKPKLVFLGASRILFPQPVKEIATAVHDYGGTVIYDGSHVLGLIAGGVFQDPLREGADCLLGSTHKTFPGPQGGVIMCNDGKTMKRIIDTLGRPYMLVDNPHVARIAALGITADEMLQFGREYAENIVKNSKRLGYELTRLGLSVKGEGLGFTESHQLLLDLDTPGYVLKDLLEEYNIFIDAIGRVGTQEITRRGMTEQDMSKVAEFIYRAINKENPKLLRSEISVFMEKFRKAAYAL
ncbi:MAG: aminotransferase class I/II-fold pyridoxal phosphate-dependent enzyme [Candidatus Njordarchaeia archaeon]